MATKITDKLISIGYDLGRMEELCIEFGKIVTPPEFWHEYDMDTRMMFIYNNSTQILDAIDEIIKLGLPEKKVVDTILVVSGGLNKLLVASRMNGVLIKPIQI